MGWFPPTLFPSPQKNTPAYFVSSSVAKTFFWQNLLQLFNLFQQQLLLFVEEILFGLEQLALIVATMAVAAMAVAVTMTDSSMVVLVFKRNLMVHVWKLFFAERGTVVR